MTFRVRQRLIIALHRLPRAIVTGLFSRTKHQPRLSEPSRTTAPLGRRGLCSNISAFRLHSRYAHAFTHLDFVEGRPHLWQGRRLRPSRDVDQTAARRIDPARPCSTAAILGRVPRPPYGPTAKIWLTSPTCSVWIMTGHWEFTYGAERVQEIVKTDLKWQDRFPRAKHQYARFRRPGVPALCRPGSQRRARLP